MVVVKSFVVVVVDGPRGSIILSVKMLVQMWSKCGPNVVQNALYLHVSQCVHFYCLPVAEDHNDCKTCKSDSTCGWAFNKGCFDLASGITGVSNKGKKASKHQQNKTHPPHTPRAPHSMSLF